MNKIHHGLFSLLATSVKDALMFTTDKLKCENLFSVHLVFKAYSLLELILLVLFHERRPLRVGMIEDAGGLSRGCGWFISIAALCPCHGSHQRMPEV